MISLCEPFDRGDVLPDDGPNPRDARALSPSIDEHGASSALSLTASVLAPGEIEMLAQHSQQTGLRIDIYGIRLVIYNEVNRSHSELQSGEDSRRRTSESVMEMIYLGRNECAEPKNEHEA